jgi:DNA-directed RNA polymerase subunit RPC12/RpoP
MSQGLCPNCGATVNLPAKQTETKCEYCESIVSIQQVESQSKQVNEAKKAKFGGVLLLAEMAQEVGKYKDALKYYNKVVGQQMDVPEVWLNRGICLVRDLENELHDPDYTITSKKINSAWGEAIKSWKMAIKFSSDIEAMKKRTASEINIVLTELFNQCDGIYDFDHGSEMDDVQKLFQLMGSAVTLALEFWPNNSVTLRNGIFLCERFIHTRDSNWRADKSDEDKTFIKTAGDNLAKYEQALEKTNPESAKQCKEARAEADAKRAIAKAERDALVEKIAGTKASKPKQKKAGCFIATACYGSYDHPIVKELRQFRDGFLELSSSGRIFVRWYYKWSPAFASLVAKSEILKAITRALIVLPSAIVARIIEKLK